MEDYNNDTFHFFRLAWSKVKEALTLLPVALLGLIAVGLLDWWLPK